MLKLYLTSGRIKFIGVTTYDEYKKHYFEKIRFNWGGIDEDINGQCTF